nr:MAG: ORF3 [Giant panda anellovirus]
MYVSGTLPQQDHSCYTHGMSTKTDSLQNTSSDNSLEMFLQLLQEAKKKSRRNCRKSTARPQQKKILKRAQAAKTGTAKRRRTRIHTAYSCTESSESESTERSSGEESSDW